MRRNKWTEKELQILRKNYATKTKREMCVFIPNHGAKAIKTMARKVGIKKDSHRKFTPSQVAILKEKYANTSNKELAGQLQCSERKLYNAAHWHGLKKDLSYIAEGQRKRIKKNPEIYSKNWFKKGDAPQNKGTKMAAETKEKVSHTFFQKGHIPHNALPVGAGRMDDDGYVWFKTEGARKVVRKHRWVWEQANGKIPKGYNVQFRDGNRQNCALENLYLISRKEQIHNNTIHRYPVEVKTAIRNIAKINKLIKN